MKGSVYLYLSVDYSFVVYPEDYQKLCADYNPMAPGAQDVGGGHSSHQAGIKVGTLAQAAVGAGLGFHTYTAMPF